MLKPEAAAPAAKPTGHLRMDGAFARYSELPSADHPLLKHDAALSSAHELAERVLTVCPKLDLTHATWYRTPAFVDGFDCEVPSGETAEERYEQFYAPTQADLDHAHARHAEQLEAYRSETDAFMALWRQENPELWTLVDTKLAAAVATKAQREASNEQVAKIEQEGGTLDASLVKSNADAIQALADKEQRASAALRTYVAEHYDEIAEMGRGAPSEPVSPPAKLSEMAHRREPPTHSYRTRYVGLRAQLREFVTALREMATEQAEEEDDGLLKAWLPSTSFRALLAAVEPGTKALAGSDAWLQEDGNKRKEANEAIAKAEVLAPVAREEDAIAHERIDSLVDYVLAAHFEYTGAAPDAPPAQSDPTDAAPKWSDVHAFVEQRLLPFLTRLVAGTKELSRKRGAEQAEGAGTFAGWLKGSDSPSFSEDVRRFKAYLEDATRVPKPQETHIGGSDRWGTKQQLIELRAHLEKTWKDADPKGAKVDRRARDPRMAQFGASAEDATR